MILKLYSKGISASFVIATVAALNGAAPPVAAQSSGAPAAQAASAPSLDYEFFEARILPIFLKKRSPDHARCYVCHSGGVGATPGGPRPYLEKLLPGRDSWTEEQSRRIFENVSKLVTPGNPTASRLLMHPLAPEAGGDVVRIHRGGRQFETQDEEDWRILAEWVRGGKLTRSLSP